MEVVVNKKSGNENKDASFVSKSEVLI